MRAKKQEIVASLKGVFSKSAAVIMMHNRGLSVAEFRDLRKKISASDGSCLVVKNSLARVALEGLAYESSLAGRFSGPVILIFCDHNDPVALIKVLVNLSKINGKIALLCGAIGSTLLEEETIRNMALLPSLNELRAKIVAALNAPVVRLVQLLKAPGEQLARVLKLHSDGESV